jgi:hypothetical protein
MQKFQQEYARYTVPQSESGLGFPLEVIVFSPIGETDLVARISPVTRLDQVEMADEITWEDAEWQ